MSVFRVLHPPSQQAPVNQIPYSHGLSILSYEMTKNEISAKEIVMNVHTYAFVHAKVTHNDLLHYQRKVLYSVTSLHHILFGIKRTKQKQLNTNV